MPELARFADAQGDNGVQVLGLALDTTDDVRGFLQQVPVDYPIVIETPGPRDASVQLGNTQAAALQRAVRCAGAAGEGKAGTVRPRRDRQLGEVRVFLQCLQPCTCRGHRNGQSQSGFPWDAGRCGWAGHAVNPSMARWRHPWRQRSCPATPPRLRQIPAAVGRCRPWSTHLSAIDIQNGIRPRADQRSAPTKAERRSDRSQETVEGGVGPVEGVRGMDAVTKATGTYLRRPRNRTHPASSQETRCCFGSCF